MALTCATESPSEAAPALVEQRGVRQGEALRSPPRAERPEAREPCGVDTFEPNDHRPRARNVSAALLAERELEGAACGVDEDWFWVWLNRGQLVELTLSGEGVEGWPPLSAFAPRKRTAQGGVRRATGSQRIKVYARKSGRYRVKVRGRGEERGRYHLSLRELTGVGSEGGSGVTPTGPSKAR